MDVFVTGTSGLLGSNVVAEATDRDFSVAGSYHSTQPAFDIPLRQLDVRDTTSFVELVDELNPTAVVNCAAMTDVDGCETQSKRASEINGRAPGNLAAACDDRGIDFVHVSTDYIFDGDSTDRYREDSEPNPLQEYGRSKLAGERTVRSAHNSPLIVRPSFIYGVNRSGSASELEGFPAWVRSQLETDQSVPLFTDQRVTPSRARSTASTLLELLDANATGTYNVAARSCVTPYEFGAEVTEQLGYSDDMLTENSLADVDHPAERPSNTCLSVEKVEQRLDRAQPSLEQDLLALEEFR